MNRAGDRFLELLSAQFPTQRDAAAEMINLTAILGLPKGTEHFLSDLHGEDEAFCQLLKNASGEIRLKIAEVFGEKTEKTGKAEKTETLFQTEQDQLAYLIYDPKKTLSHAEKTVSFYRQTISRLILLCRAVADKYTRSKVRRALPKDFSYIIEELLHVHESTPNRKNYHQGIIDAIIEEGQAEAFIGVLCSLISRLAVDHLHILGDIFDRGDGPHRILDILQTLPNVDICWGNHDILWMGANLGNPLCVATAVRFSLRYNHPKLLEQGYGIPLRNLFSLAEKLYGQTSCTCFLPIGETTPDCFGIARAQKVICVILWKLELSFCREHPDYEFNLSCTLEHLDQQNRTILCDQTAYPLADADFPTVNPEKPWELTEEEQAVLNGLCESFSDSEKLSGHVRFLIKKGGMYQVMNKNLLYHGCIPMTEDGSFASFLGYRGRSFMDFCDRTVRKAYFLEKGHPEKQFAVDFFWYLFSGKHSPLFGKQEMKTLPGYLISEPSVHRETKNPYYQLIEGEKGRETARMILSEFSLYEEHSKIINGHVPVRTSRGESPKKAGGLLFMIDGGLSPSYYQTTGIGGYTLLYNSHGFFLTAHEPFSKETPEKLRSYRVLGEKRDERIRVADTDTGLLLKKRIRELRRLTGHYRRGILLEK